MWPLLSLADSGDESMLKVRVRPWDSVAASNPVLRSTYSAAQNTQMRAWGVPKRSGAC